VEKEEAVVTKCLWHDKQFGAAILVAPIAWFLLAWLIPSEQPHAIWPASDPGRLLILVLVYPVLEELLFRGWMQGELRQLHWGTTTFVAMSSANLLTSSAFTASHFFMHPPLAAIAVLAPSLIFGYFRDRYDGCPGQRMAAPIGLHIWYNAGYFLLFTSQ